jgi:phage gpG-like protein
VIRIDVDSSAADRVLLRLDRELENPAGLLDEIGRTVLDLARTGFARSTDPWGQTWAELARSRPGGGPLVKTGALLASGTYSQSGDEVTVSFGGGSGSPASAVFHQYGTDKMPARPILPLTEAGAYLPPLWQADVVDLVESALDEIARS